MLKILYVITIAMSSLMTVNQQALPYFLKYGIAFGWIIIAFFKMRINGTAQISIPKYLSSLIKTVLLPIVVAFVYTIIIWLCGLNDGFEFGNISRLISNLGCLAILILCATLSAYIFGKDVIYLTFYSVMLAIAYNFIVVLSEYGTANMMLYLKNVFVIDSFDYYSIPRTISYSVELHDPTFAVGVFFVYFLFYEDKEKKTRLVNIVLCLIGLYIGFKRNSILGFVLATSIAVFIIRKHSKNFLKANQILGFFVAIGCFLFVILVKNIDQYAWFVSMLDIARYKLYSYMSKMYELSPFYYGTGFSYVNYTLGSNTIGLLGTSHSDLLRIYVEMGFFGFFAWIWYYFVKIPRVLYCNYSQTAGKMCMVMSFYIFATFFLDNTLTLFANQYAFYLIPIAYALSDYKKKLRFNMDKFQLK